MATRKPSKGLPGSVSSGTMRPEDLIPDFWSIADGLSLQRDERKEVTRIGKDMQKKKYYTSENSEYDLDTLFGILENHAPKNCYFGAHPGDGADYGWWGNEDE